MNGNDFDPLIEIQAWYLSRCNGEWEHSYGIKISTLDNPGWSFRVGLTETGLENLAFEEIRVIGGDENDWHLCKVQNQVFEAHCGPKRLHDVISIFLHWAGHGVRQQAHVPATE